MLPEASEQIERTPPPPRMRTVAVPGEWHLSNGSYLWVPAHTVRKLVAYHRWVPSHHTQSGVLIPGHWV